jgi:hypothetical protein
MVYELTVPDQQPPFAAALLAKFRRGDDRERDLLADLARIGRDTDPPFAVAAQQERFELRGRDGVVVISGKVDARISVGRGFAPPLEIKAWSPTLVDRIETFDDLFESPWTRAGGYQLLAYLYASEEPFGFLMLDRSGLPLLLPVELTAQNLDRMEAFLSRAERVVAHARAGTLPDYLDDPAECRRCPFYGATCNPPLSASAPAVIVDAELEAALERWHALRESGREWQALDDDLKKRLRGVEGALVGHFSISGKWSRSSRVELPPELKKQYTVTEARGRFSLEIDRL